MLQTVEIFYSFDCPYSYLAIDRLSQIESTFDVKVLWQPYSPRSAGKNFQSGSNISQDKLSYIREDATRLAKQMEMPLVFREEWPEQDFDAEKSTRGALVASDRESTLEFNIKVFHRWWGEGEDPNDQSFFIELCDDLDVDANEFAGRINSSEIRERLRGVVRRGRKLQIFETPTIVINEERFVGIDRINQAIDKLKELKL